MSVTLILGFLRFFSVWERALLLTRSIIVGFCWLVFVLFWCLWGFFIIFLFPFNFLKQVCNLETGRVLLSFDSTPSQGNKKLKMPLFPATPLRYRTVFLWDNRAHVRDLQIAQITWQQMSCKSDFLLAYSVFFRDTSMHWKWFPQLTHFSAWPFICRAWKISRTSSIWKQESAWGTGLCRKLQ